MNTCKVVAKKEIGRYLFKNDAGQKYKTIKKGCYIKFDSSDCNPDNIIKGTYIRIKNPSTKEEKFNISDFNKEQIIDIIPPNIKYFTFSTTNNNINWAMRLSSARFNPHNQLGGSKKKKKKSSTGIKRVKAKNGRIMYFKNGKQISKDKALKKKKKKKK